MPYVDAPGISIYYEESGSGPPLVLLHGGLMTIELNFGEILAPLSQNHRVVAIELQGHGRTADTDRPMSFENLAADVIGVLDAVGIDRADVFGFSLGGLTAYQLLVAHPTRVRRAIIASAHHHNEREGELLPGRLPTAEDFESMRQAYLAVAPDPTRFDESVQRIGSMVQEFAGWSDEQLKSIVAPVLVLIGDTDFVLVPSAAEATTILPDAQLAVLPGTTHMGIVGHPLVLPIVEAFLTG